MIYFKDISAIIFIVLIQGCTKHIYVPVTSLKHEIKENYIRDSIYIHDSIVVKQKNDTIFSEKFKLIYRDKFIRDSFFLIDSVQIPYPVEKVVYKNKPKGWLKESLIGLLIIALIVQNIRRKY